MLHLKRYIPLIEDLLSLVLSRKITAHFLKEAHAQRTFPGRRRPAQPIPTSGLPGAAASPPPAAASAAVSPPGIPGSVQTGVQTLLAFLNKNPGVHPMLSEKVM